VGAAILHPHEDRVCDPIRSRWPAVPMRVSDNECAISELKLRTVVLADLYSFGKSECISQPTHCLPNV